MINEDAVRAYLFKQFRDVLSVDIRKLGSGVQGSGFLVEISTRKGTEAYVIKSLIPEGFGHDYPSDRASVFLLDFDEFNNLPKHVRAVDVLAEMDDGSVKSVSGGKEYYLLMEKGAGRDYFYDLKDFAHRNRLDDSDIRKIKALTSYLAGIHSVKKTSETLYLRKLRDTVGHGECMMGILDMYPKGTLPSKEMADIVKKSVDWVYKLKPKFRRLSQIHGDFHPGNIWFKEKEGLHTSPGDPLREADFILLDRSRGPWGDPADDITALTVNYIFFSLKNHESVKGPYLEALKLFYDDYVRLSGDDTIYTVVQLFYAFRGIVVANPVFYPELSTQQRAKLFGFVHSVLDSERFEPERVNEYLQ